MMEAQFTTKLFFATINVARPFTSHIILSSKRIINENKKLYYILYWFDIMHNVFRIKITFSKTILFRDGLYNVER